MVAKEPLKLAGESEGRIESARITLQLKMTKWATKVATIAVGLAIPGVIAPRQREATILRTVRGTVIDAQGRALPSSVVYLRHQKSGDVRTQITEGNGQYRFSGLDPHADYEIHARHGDGISSVYKLYAADGKRDLVLDLKVDKKTRGHIAGPRFELSTASLPALPRTCEFAQSLGGVRVSRAQRLRLAYNFVAKTQGRNTPPLG